MRMRLHALLIVAVGLLMAADNADKSKDDLIKKELDKMQGTWIAISAERDGEKRSKDEIKDLKFVVKGDKWSINLDGQEYQGTLKIDPTKTPKQSDSIMEDGQTVQAIYECDDVHLKLCWRGPGEDRPKEFVSKPDTGINLVVFKRAKP
jgi:uncharacterized protein (TIGR03067 family)